MTAVFRVDGSTTIGIGHIVRSLCLADGLKKRGINSVFVCKDYRGNLIGKIEQKGVKVEALDRNADLEEDLDFTAQTVKKNKADILVTDSYHITGDYLRKIRKEVKLLVSIDDIVQTHFYADILLNQNAGVREEDYQGKIEAYTKLLLGPRYALVRNEFSEKHARQKQVNHNTNNILVALGGGDPYNQTLKAVRAITDISSLSLCLKLITGPSYQHAEELEEFVSDNCKNVYIIKNCQNIAEIMYWADLAVSAGGSTCWELACLGAPNLIIVLADNQRRVAQELDKMGISINLGWFEGVSEFDIKKSVLELLHNPQKREQMSKRGKQLVDGRGVERVSNEIWRLLEVKRQRLS